MIFMRSKAIVFDNSGTLIERYRIIKDLNTGEFITDINSLSLIDNLDCGALAILQFNTGCLSKLDSDTLISDLINDYHIQFTVSYSTRRLSHDEILSIINNDDAVISDITEGFSILKKQVPNMEICNGTALILDCKNRNIAYTITTAGRFFNNAIFTVNQLKNRGYDIFIASGDRSDAIQTLTEFLDIDPSHGFPTATPLGKRDIVKSLRKDYDKVVMVGDGQNDYYAFQESDLAILTIAQSLIESDQLISSSDYIVDDLIELLNILH